MKISYRILIINFAIVVVILGSSAIAFYSIMYNVLSSQQSKYLLNASNNFIYNMRNMLQDADDEFQYIVNNNIENAINSPYLNTKNIDFILETKDKNSEVFIKKIFKQNIFFPSSIKSLKEFRANNPYTIIQSAQLPNGYFCYYGSVISNAFLADLSSKINADIAVVRNGSIVELSNETQNRNNVYLLNEIYKSLAPKNNFDLITKSTESFDIIATIYKPSADYFQANNLQFIIFSTLQETSNLRTSLKYILLIIGSAGIFLSLILTLVFTDKIRKQIVQLSNATRITTEGNFQNKIEVQSKDELGHLASAFNIMLDELRKNERTKNEYSEFITLLNQNPSLTEISDAALHKIISTCGFTIGALYTFVNDEIQLTSSYGIGNEVTFLNKKDLFDAVIKNKEVIEISSESADDLPVVSAGVFSLELRYLLILPIVYNNKVVAILELGSVNNPSADTNEYLSKIKDQLAIGLTNALAYVQLANLVTELKILNEDYQKQNLQIRKQNETLIELHNNIKEKAAELEVQKQKAEEATKLKSHFLASMSHELRTPMNSILGLTELMIEDKSLSLKNKERIGVVFKSGKRLMNLINDILDLSKIEAGKMIIHNEDILLENLIQDVENSIITLVGQKDLSFKIIKKFNTNILISTDRGKVAQVLINLIGNAVKFTENGFIELHVSKYEDRNLKFDVIDSGIGISEKDQKFIFEEFRQIDETTTRKYQGTGLGLAISKKIADLMNGSLHVKSELGKGSIFTFVIPLNAIKITKSSSPNRPNITTLIKNRHNPILVIDDEHEVRYTIGQYLTVNGYDVVYANNGNEGIEKAKMLQPFAITLDVMMPGKDGWTVLKELKELEETKDIPVILISILGDKNLGYGLGAFEYFVKPVASDKLIATFKKLEILAKKKIEKIIIVDDDESEFERFKQAFKKDEIRIEYIKDSELAFSKILETQPDLIILGLIMPHIDGITLSHKLKTCEDTKHIPIILSTTKDLTTEEQNSLKNIVEDIITKTNDHPLDVLRAVKERIQWQENPSFSQTKLISDTSSYPGEQRKEIYQGIVLIVDDDPDSLFTISEILEVCDCKTILAKNGIECIKILEQTLPDLILLDIMMPELDGFQTISLIRQNEKWANIPVYAITAKAMLEDKQVILRHGFDDYVAKPVNSGVLAFKIERLFTKQNLE
ncbi:MAG: response regulator [Ignavibacteriaceae bacterium]|jgi:CheY-like chemotaxis protein/signal transduction histidine kinase/methyl-accepting chemotaxis protein